MTIVQDHQCHTALQLRDIEGYIDCQILRLEFLERAAKVADSVVLGRPGRSIGLLRIIKGGGLAEGVLLGKIGLERLIHKCCDIGCYFCEVGGANLADAGVDLAAVLECLQRVYVADEELVVWVVDDKNVKEAGIGEVEQLGGGAVMSVGGVSEELKGVQHDLRVLSWKKNVVCRGVGDDGIILVRIAQNFGKRNQQQQYHCYSQKMGNSCQQHTQEGPATTMQLKGTNLSLRFQQAFVNLTSKKEAIHKKDFVAMDIPKNSTPCNDFYSKLPPRYSLDFAKLKALYRKLPPLQLENGDLFEGHWRLGRKCGVGILIRPDGTITQGEWKDDQLIKGRVIFPNGDISIREEGESHDKYIFSNGVAFIGDSTYGREIYPDGTIYEGEYEHGMKNGKGAFNFPDGSSFKGDFLDNQFSGYGVFVFGNGSVYEGQWLMGLMHGTGQLKHADGREYKGEFRYGYKHGFGQMKYSDGTEFVGQFEHGKRQGKGRWIENGMPHEREFDQGHMLEAAFRHSKELKELKETEESMLQ